MNYECRVCGAHATGFHFEAQSCSACCAFFRRAISLQRNYKCTAASITPENVEEQNSPSKQELCRIVYSNFSKSKHLLIPFLFIIFFLLFCNFLGPALILT